MPSEKTVRAPARVRVAPVSVPADGLTPKQIAEMLTVYEGITKIMEAVKGRAIKLAHSGVDIPGYEASFTAARRMWAAGEEGTAKHLKRLGLPDPWAPRELLSPAQAEKALRAAGKWPKGKASEDFTSPFEPVLGYTDTKPSISKVSAK